NAAIHDSKLEPDKKQAWRCICDLHDILVFFINSYENKDLYYIRPDISIEAQTDEAHYFYRQNKNAQHIKLSDHRVSKKKNPSHLNKNLKKAKHYSSSTKKNVQPKKENSEHTPKENIFTKVMHLFNKKGR
ncbi:MAG: hypothetical protein ACI4TY_05520, partial [Candidatus Limosilactobacillus intestinavium]